MLTLYGKRLSRAGRCLWVLEELGLRFTHVPIDPLAGGTQTAEFAALNPAKKIPVLADGDFVLRESVAIVGYLVEQKSAPLWPDDAQLRARIAQWSSWAISEMEPPFTRLVREKRSAAPNDDAIAVCIADAATALTVLEEHLAHGHACLASDDFTIADINAATAAMLAPMFLDMSGFPATAEWLGRVLARPAWQRVQSYA